MSKTIKLPSRARGVQGVHDWAKEVIARPIIDGRLVEGEATSTSGTSVNHGLGRVPRGAIVVKSDSAILVVASAFDKDTITLTSASGTPTVSVWIF